jgi:uncharacterized protein YacL
MDATHIHLILSHFPIIGTVIGTGILAFGLYSNNMTTKNVAFVTFIFMAILTIPVFLSGEEAEEVVENMAGISENLIEEHEDLAEIAIWIMGVLGGISIVSFYTTFKNLSFAKAMAMITFLISIVTFGFFAKLGNLGGLIRHSEIRKNTVKVNLQNDYKIINERGEDDDDDDD